MVMTETIFSTGNAVTRCGVLKIDLNGRIVFVDDEIEKIFGLSHEDLFGHNISEFISQISKDLLESIFNRHKRYESHYEAINLDLAARKGNEGQFVTVISLTFIAGNPANYELIVIPDPESPERNER